MSLQQQLSAVTDMHRKPIPLCKRHDLTADIIGSSALIAVNPHKYVASNADSILQKYYRSTSENKATFLPASFGSPIAPTTT